MCDRIGLDVSNDMSISTAKRSANVPMGAAGHFVYVQGQDIINMAKKIESPCIASCRLQGGLCVDCGRSVEEIRRWKAMKHPEKMATVKRAEQRRKKVNSDEY